MRVCVTVLLIIGLIGMGNLTFATEQKTDQDSVSQKITDTSGMVEENGFTGVVNKTAQGYTLTAGEETYLLQGEMLEDLVGKSVNISGKLLKGDTNDTILVAKAQITE